MCNVLHTPRTAVIIYNWFDVAVNYDCSRLYQNICAAWTARLELISKLLSIHFQLSWLSLSYKLVKILSVCVCLDVNKGATNRYRCTQRLACTDLLVNSDRISKLGQSDLLYRSISPTKKWAWIGIFKPAERHRPWDVCYIKITLFSGKVFYWTAGCECAK